jgi:hypothetical protein
MLDAGVPYSQNVSGRDILVQSLSLYLIGLLVQLSTTKFDLLVAQRPNSTLGDRSNAALASVVYTLVTASVM